MNELQKRILQIAALALALVIGFFSGTGKSGRTAVTDPENHNTQAEDTAPSGGDGETDTVEDPVPSDPAPEGAVIPAGSFMLSAYLSYRCLSFYPNQENIVITVDVGDSYSYQQARYEEYIESLNRRNRYTDQPETPDTRWTCFACYDEELHYPILWAADRDELEFLPSTDGKKLIINGQKGEFKKKFTLEDMTSLDIPIARVQVDRAKVHHESLVIDFSQLDEGDTGIISFGFGWYRGDTSYVPDQKGTIEGNSVALYYYKGQQGIYLSMGGYEMVKEQCEKGAPASVIDFDFNKMPFGA